MFSVPENKHSMHPEQTSTSCMTLIEEEQASWRMQNKSSSSHPSEMDQGGSRPPRSDSLSQSLSSNCPGPSLVMPTPRSKFLHSSNILSSGTAPPSGSTCSITSSSMTVYPSIFPTTPPPGPILPSSQSSSQSSSASSTHSQAAGSMKVNGKYYVGSYHRPPLLRHASGYSLEEGERASGMGHSIPKTEPLTPTFPMDLPVSSLMAGDSTVRSSRLSLRRESLSQASKTSTASRGTLSCTPEPRASPMSGISGTPGLSSTPLREDWCLWGSSEAQGAGNLTGSGGEGLLGRGAGGHTDPLISDEYSTTPLWRARDTMRGGLVLIMVMYLPHPSDTLVPESPLPSAIFLAQQLAHIPGILAPLDCYYTGNDWVIIYPWFGEVWGRCPKQRGITLLDMMEAHGGILSEQLSRIILREVVSILVEVHAMGLAHGGIHPQNLLVNSRYEVRLMDFHHSVARPQSGASHTPADPAAEASPFDHPDSAVMDAWSLGILMYRMLEGCLPWPSTHLAQKRQWRLDGWVGSAEAKWTVECLLDPNPFTRWTVQNLKESAWLTAPPTP
ncbi:kinase-like domain-containing protein [Piptocephalis cylindrospora]|uniref:non-specific serine/threonine protein kinase n=1 Tax=Piptocephalis cylindrospora TaxID=1907219 RepID=A0A4V1IYF0_9FUNG|nr:kinase-like domain-containing protein [Piptocephalis cylindrospora]|eukprot:RKP14329.1 kinase-like domain-containing protein [Piptocephalis cylindrospora]